VLRDDNESNGGRKWRAHCPCRWPVNHGNIRGGHLGTLVDSLAAGI